MGNNKKGQLNAPLVEGDEVGSVAEAVGLPQRLPTCKQFRCICARKRVACSRSHVLAAVVGALLSGLAIFLPVLLAVLHQHCAPGDTMGDTMAQQAMMMRCTSTLEGIYEVRIYAYWFRSLANLAVFSGSFSN